MSNQDYQQAFVRLRSKTTGEWLASEDLRPLMVADAIEQQTNLTEIALRILAERYGIKHKPNGRRTNPGTDEAVLNLRVPGKLARAIQRTAGNRWCHQIRFDLQDHYGLLDDVAA